MNQGSWAILLCLLLCCGIHAADGQTRELPSSFDLRNWGGINYVTSVKSQQGGTCWTHGVCAAMEGNLKMTGVWMIAGEAGEPNLAEYHLDWWNGFNNHNNDDIEPPTGTGLVPHEGGDYLVTSAYLARGEGMVRNIDGQSYSTPPLRDDPGYHKYYTRHIEFLSAGFDLSNIDQVKQAIMDHGVMGTCMLYESQYMDYENYTHYQPKGQGGPPNHAIAIVGWDDNKVTQAPEPGAWLCKNSWGSYWGLDGYFWISYYDQHCGQNREMGAITFRAVEPLQWNHIYYHDYHGRRNTRGDMSEAFNKFVTTSFGEMTAVNFYTATENVTYTLKIYDSFIDFELGGEIYSQTGFFEYRGLHTVELDTILTLIEGDDFFIYLQFSNGGHPIDQTSDVPVLLGADYRVIVPSSAAPDQSYYRNQAGYWEDLHDLDSTANFCMKALTNDLPEAIGVEMSDVVPDYYDPDLEMPLTIQVAEGTETFASGMLRYREKDGPFDVVPLTDLGGGVCEGILPAMTCDDTPEFYFEVTGSGGTTLKYPANAPATCLKYIVGHVDMYMDDNFETDLGWTTGGDAVAGHWERGAPVGGGDRGDPAIDFDGSGQCYLTGNTDGDSDVDYGQTSLISPAIDLDSRDADIAYALWYCNNYSGSPNEDLFHIHVSNDDGQSWVLVETVGPMTIERWTLHSFTVSDFVVPSATVRVKFEASDYGGASVVEAAVDRFTVTQLVCQQAYVCGDASNDGSINVGDGIYLINYVFKSGPEPQPMAAGDVNGDGSVSVADAVYLINYIFKSGPELNCP